MKKDDVAKTDRDKAIEGMIQEWIVATAKMNGLTPAEVKKQISGTQRAHSTLCAATAFDEGRTSILAPVQ